MPPKRPFTDEQLEILFETVERASRNKKKFKNQEELALSLDITQPAVSALIRRKWAPGVTTARHIANLEGKTLLALIGPYDEEPPPSEEQVVKHKGDKQTFPNLETCVQFHQGTKGWHPWTIAAARAGYFGPNDLPPPAWTEKLDHLEKTLERARKVG